ncbi:MAG: helix-turn-helix domain-containing protein [Acidobacteriota bacterium]|nr:helix-turn-helix domain-containing protein [Acidobacteriota bacterium]
MARLGIRHSPLRQEKSVEGLRRVKASFAPLAAGAALTRPAPFLLRALVGAAGIVACGRSTTAHTSILEPIADANAQEWIHELALPRYKKYECEATSVASGTTGAIVLNPNASKFWQSRCSVTISDIRPTTSFAPVTPSRGPADGSIGQLEELLTVDEVAAWLKVSKSWVYEHTRIRGRHRPEYLPHIKLGKYVRFDPRAVRAFLARESRTP